MSSQDITIQNIQPHQAEEAALVICAAYEVPPEECTSANQCSTADDILVQLQKFPEGQFAALDGEKVVGVAQTMRITRPPDKPKLPWMEAIGGLHLDNHDPNGDWLYGVEMVVLPAYRKRGIGTKLYEARFDLVRRLNLRGWYAGGMLMGYYRYRDQMTPREYGDKVIAREIVDPTVTMQMNRGFEPVRVIEDYLDETPAGDAAVLIIWNNKDYDPNTTS